MKINPLPFVRALSGKMGDLVYCYNKETGKMYTRKNTYPKISENHHKMGSVMKQICRLGCSPDYTEDLRRYANFYQKERRQYNGCLYNSNNVLLKLMYNLVKAYPEVDLLTITKDYIYANDLPCITIKRAVEAGLLQKVERWESMDHPI